MQVSLSRNINPNQVVNLKTLLSDQRILFSRLRAKDAAAFKILYQQYAAAIFGCIIRSVTDQEKASSILEQTFCEVWQSFPEYNETDVSIFTWIHRIASQKIKNFTL